MKVKVNVKFKVGGDPGAVVALVVGAADTVSSLKERVAIAHAIPFPDQDLVLDGEILADSRTLSDCQVAEGSSMDLLVKASESILVQQLTVLLKARDLSSDELALLYCYKYGASMSQALKMVGHDEQLQDFVNNQKGFVLENGRVMLVREDTTLKPFSLTDEVVQILKANGSGAMEIKELCSKFMQKFNVSFSSIAGGRATDFFAKEKALFCLNGRGLVSLKAAAPAAAAAAAPARAAARRAQPPPCEHDAATGKECAELMEAESDNQAYLDLHSTICTRAYTSRVAQLVGEVVDVVLECTFLKVRHVVKGGSVGKGTSIAGVTDAEAVFFLDGLPTVDQRHWLPPLLQAVVGVLTECLRSEDGVEGLRATEDSVQMRVKGAVLIDLRFSPVFDSYSQAIETLGQQVPDARKFYGASLAKERAQFIAKQPSQVKITMRLVKWWRNQQDWSCKLARPSDELLELVAVYSAVQTKPCDQRTAVANVMSLLSRFNELRIVWSNYYAKADVWSPLLRQRPLMMDPTNPFVNIGDTQTFDSSELMVLATTTHFFW